MVLCPLGLFCSFKTKWNTLALRVKWQCLHHAAMICTKKDKKHFSPWPFSNPLLPDYITMQSLYFKIKRYLCRGATVCTEGGTLRREAKQRRSYGKHGKHEGQEDNKDKGTSDDTQTCHTAMWLDKSSRWT